MIEDEVNYRNNPLHSIGLKVLLNELVNHYGFDILSAYLNINCFKVNPSIESSAKFLKKTEWMLFTGGGPDNDDVSNGEQ